MDGSLKGIVPLKKVVPNRYKFFSAEHKRRYFEEFRLPNSWWTNWQSVFFWYTFEVNGVLSLCLHQN